MPLRVPDDRRNDPARRFPATGPLPDGAATYLTVDNPKLQDLVRRYARLEPRVTEPLVWKPGYVDAHDLKYFRGDNAYMWQWQGGFDEIHYVLTAYYVKNVDRLGLFETLCEDGAFGAFTCPAADRRISRDLLDSILEIDFLERNLQISCMRHLNILDIGAGYGRLAHRMLTALSNIDSYICVDAIPCSTFLCDYYLAYRQVGARARVVPLDQVGDLVRGEIDLAVNIHSFSECTPAAIRWWVELSRELAVAHLMVVPNPHDHGGTRLQTNPGQDFRPIIESQGYRLIAMEPKYRDPSVQTHGIFPTHYHLFALSR